MGYIERSLVPGERIVARATLSWLPLIGPVILGCLLALIPVLVAIGLASNAAGPGLGALPGVLCCAILLPLVFLPALLVLIALMTTELAVTDRRIVGKTGWISRRTIEVLLPQVESVGVSQGIFGRLLGYGIVQVRGTGGSASHFPYINDPTGFRRYFAAQADAAQRRVTIPPPAAPALPPVQTPVSLGLFEVQIVDRDSGAERWIDVRADTVEHAKAKVAAAGEIVGGARLKSMS